MGVESRWVAEEDKAEVENMQQQRHSADGSSQTESNDIVDDRILSQGTQQRISRLRATLVEVCALFRRPMFVGCSRIREESAGVGAAEI